jgi:hypothetical protein
MWFRSIACSGVDTVKVNSLNFCTIQANRADRGVVPGVREGLRRGPRHRVMVHAHAHPPLHLLPVGPLRLVQVGHVCRGREAEPAVDVHADHVLGIHPRDLRRHVRTQIAALGAVTVVAEAMHQCGPHPGDPVDGEAVLAGGACENP